eukprot:CAMPEP_0185279748 /NCGR_PEP_ID=MMETSP1359-20130426/64267_1 /TAXON_ID=552665 /ORGANISM="Bigelowiella longifila, Strain CCMP242" /LENGTH=223 /DNA_ID=CAMNT_0027874715 /DNA_START=27 /DNA_END=698 /DNA_ORIENTATION=+
MALGGEHVSVTERNGCRIGMRRDNNDNESSSSSSSNRKSGSNADHHNSYDKLNELPDEHSPRELRFLKALEEEGGVSTAFLTALHFLNEDPGFASSDATILNETYAVITKVYEERLLQLNFKPGIVFYRCMELKTPHGQLREDATRVVEIPRTSDIRALRTPFKCKMIMPYDPDRPPPIHSRISPQQSREGEHYRGENFAGGGRPQPDSGDNHRTHSFQKDEM